MDGQKELLFTYLAKLLQNSQNIIDNMGLQGSLAGSLAREPCKGALQGYSSKAFDIKHDLLIAKLHAYELSPIALELSYNYPSHRKRNGKINNAFGEWRKLKQVLYKNQLYEFHYEIFP